MLNTLLKFIRRKAVSDCQKVISQYAGYDTSFILAKMADLKLFVPDDETQRQIDEYEKDKKDENQTRDEASCSAE